MEPLKDDLPFLTDFKLTCLINDSAGVVATNTAAVQLANARDKPW
jgi:hypothetical protein